MYNIDDIMDMLDWNKSEEEQRRGVELGRSIRNINVFLQPCNPNACKNVWENSAKILIDKSDDLLSPYSSNLLEWIADLNWPGAELILERLKHFEKVDSLAYALSISVKTAASIHDEMWLVRMAELLDNPKLSMHLSQDTKDILQTYYHLRDDSE